MSTIVKYLKEVSGKATFWEIFKNTGIHALIDGKVAETVLVHGPGGTLVGTDESGNQYYEANTRQVGRNRWVVYKEKAFDNIDASTVPPEWHGWLCFVNDDPPTLVVPVDPIYKVAHSASKTATEGLHQPKGSWIKGAERRRWGKYEAWQPPRA